MDAEFFRRQHLVVEEKLATRICETVADVAAVSDGNHFSISESFVDEGMPYYRGQDVVGHFFIEQASPNKITREAFDQPLMRRSHLQQGDVLLSIIGTVGETSLVKTKQEATCSCKLAILRPKNIDPAYLATYLSSAIGRSLTERWKRGAVQTGLLLEDMDQIPVPRFSKGFEAAVGATVGKAYTALESSQRAIESAETQLLQALELENWKVPEDLTYVRSSHGVFAAGRLDAEHFQEGYFALREKLTSLKFGCSSIGELSQSLTNGAEIREYQTNGTPYLRVGDIRNLTVDENSVVKVDTELAKDEMDKVGLEVGDVLVSRSGSLAVTAVVEPEWVGALISSHLIRVRIGDSDFDPYYVALFLSALPGRMQIQQWSNGGVQPEISQPSLRKIIVPRLPIATQREIRDGILAARMQRESATQLLAAAKRAVEIAIEDSETAALDHLAACERGAK